jgi:hypothetical protein
VSGTGTVRRPILLFPYFPIGQSYSRKNSADQKNKVRGYKALASLIPLSAMSDHAKKAYNSADHSRMDAHAKWKKGARRPM